MFPMPKGERKPKKQAPSYTPAELDAARTGAKRVLEKSRAYVVLDHPFFATPMLKKPMTESLSIPTLAVKPDGSVYYNPFFVAGMTTENQVFNTCHEIMHYLGDHEGRYLRYIAAHAIPDNGKNRLTWNKAGDYWINDTLVRSAVGVQTPGTLSRPGSADRTVEDIMDELRQEEDEGGDEGEEGDDPGEKGDQPGDGPSNPLEGDMEMGDDLSDSERGELDAQRKIDIAEAVQIAKMKGKLPGALQKFAESAIAVKTPWYDILERYMVERIKNDTSWAKPNRRYTPDFYMPITDGIGAMGEVVIQVDVSGSVSRQEIRHYNGHLKRIVEQCNPSKVHVIYTDTHVLKHETFDKPEDLEIQFHSGGGTDMREGFKFLHAQGITPEVVITLTDGFTPFPEQLDVPAIWCISHKENKAPVGENVYFELEA